jgi:HK97 family phage portal protein
VRLEAFGFDLRLSRVGVPSQARTPARGSGGWIPVVREPFTGAWQRNYEALGGSVLNYAPVFACVRLISTDIAKMRCRLVERQPSGIWQELESPAFSPFLRKPNRYQSRIKFFETWMISKLLHGNTYALKQRDARGLVVAAYILEPTRVKVLVGGDGSVWYECRADNLAGTSDTVAVPAAEMFHDLYLPLYHPLIGVSPITACATAALEALAIQLNASTFFASGSQPGGVITAPGSPSPEALERIKAAWNEGFTGQNVGKVAVLADAMKYEQLTVNAADAQLVEQLNWTALDVCQAFGVPPYKINVGPELTLAGSYQATEFQYYSRCLQELIENVEETIDLGLGLSPDTIDGRRLGVEFDRGDLLQMDTAARVEAATKTVTAGVLSPNEARVRFLDAPPVAGGGSPMMQQQQFSLEALAERDQAQPFVRPTAPPPAAQAEPAEADDALEARAADLLRAALAGVAA